MSADENADLKAEAAALDGEFIKAGEGISGGGDSAASTPPAGPSTGDILTALLIPTFAIMAPAWNVSEHECSLVGHTYGDVIDKYFPDIDFGVEFAAAIATAAVFGPRMRTPRHHPRPNDDGKKEESAG